MKRILIFILPLLIITAVVFVIFGIFQVRSEEAKMMDEIKRKTKTVAESTEFSVKYIFQHNDLQAAHRVVQRFQKRERFQGCVIYDKDGNIAAITERFADWKKVNKPYIQEILKDRAPQENTLNFKNYPVYSYAMPVLNDGGAVIGVVEVIYDTSYVRATLNDMWKRINIALIILVLLITVIVFFTQKRMFSEPINHLTEWFRHFQKGEVPDSHKLKAGGELGKLATEVEQVALSLKVAQKNISDQARARIDEKDLWTEVKLKDLVRAKLGENSLFAVSNREPYMHVMDEKTKTVKCIRPASGVVTAMDPIMRACSGTWVAHGSGDADKKFVNSKDKLGVPPEDSRYILKRIWLSKEEEEGYYYGFANEGLWPLCHITYTRPIFRESDWQMYKEVNQKFADSVISELPAKNPFVFIHDYHFTLLPRMIKEKRPDAKIALFWHIPWPNTEVFSICPYRKEILDGMLGCDLIGFHIQQHCNNFIDTVNSTLECRIDNEKSSIIRNKKETFIRPFPISVDPYVSQNILEKSAEQKNMIREKLELDGKIVMLSVERIDYTKGISERILAIDRFLEKYPEYKKKFVFIQLAAPSRTHIKRYHDLMSEIDELIEKKNWKHCDGAWKPIIYLKYHFSMEEIAPFYAIADICIVSSLHDGMNLVAKEFVAAKKGEAGALILSCFTGASRELADAVMVNPYYIEEFADKIKYAMDMPSKEKKQRMENMYKIVSENNIYRWAGDIITDIASLQSKGYETKPR